MTPYGNQSTAGGLGKWRNQTPVVTKPERSREILEQIVQCDGHASFVVAEGSNAVLQYALWCSKMTSPSHCLRNTSQCIWEQRCGCGCFLAVYDRLGGGRSQVCGGASKGCLLAHSRISLWALRQRHVLLHLQWTHGGCTDSGGIRLGEARWHCGLRDKVRNETPVVFRTDIKKGLGVSAKSLIYNV